VILQKNSGKSLGTAVGVSLMMCLFSAALPGQIAADAARRAAQEDDIREAIFRYEMKERQGTIFLNINNQDPSDTFMRRFSDVKLSVKKLSAIAPPKRPAQRWIYDRKTGKLGVALWVGKFTWTSDHGAIVDGGYYCGSLCAGRGDFYVAPKEGVWVVEKFDLKVIS